MSLTDKRSANDDNGFYVENEEDYEEYDKQFHGYGEHEINDSEDSSSARPYLFSTEQYPCFCEENKQPLTRDEVLETFENLQKCFGFQEDSKKNMYDHFMVQVDSRASRLTCEEAIITLHADYIGGENANYRKWYYATMLSVDGASDLTLDVDTANFEKEQALNDESIKFKTTTENEKISKTFILDEALNSKTLDPVDQHWKMVNGALNAHTMVEQIALYLLIWGEANQIRFTPETICFIYKLAWDKYKHYKTLDHDRPIAKEFEFLEKVINPLYTFLKLQTYKKVNGEFMKRDRDHKSVIGYDDVNQLFWYKKGLQKIKVDNKIELISLPKNERYDRLKDVNWNKVFFKTYKERRTWWHMITNFNRIWIIHLSTFWYYTAFNSPTLYTMNYIQTLDNKPLPQATFSIVSLGSVIACIIQIFATIGEWYFVPHEWPGRQKLLKRFLLILLITIINISPSGYILIYVGLATFSKSAYILSIIQFVISIITTLFFSIVPLGSLFGSYLTVPKKNGKKYFASKAFTASFPELPFADRVSSYIIWFIVFACKFTESYYFLTLSLKDPIRVLSTMKMTRCVGEKYIGNILCLYQPQIVLGLIYLTDLVLFFLDTYLWYIIVNCIFSCISSYKGGFSVLSPWKNQYGSLPKRIYTKILATNDMAIKWKPTILISQIWNSIVITMYKEHIISLDHVDRLLYHQIESEVYGKVALKDPSFFVAKSDTTDNVVTEYFPKKSEAERRLSFFARSLASTIPDPVPVESMPTFTVLIPHYSEKIILDFKEVIKENGIHSKLTILEYLKILYQKEWEFFVNDTRLVAKDGGELKQANAEASFYNQVSAEHEDPYRSKMLDIPFLLVGFKSEHPALKLRTRIWASLRTQTLYRTISGFMNYAKALRVLYRVENPELINAINDEGGDDVKEIETMAFRKFKMVVSMQRYEQFNEHEKEAAELLLKNYPHLQIAYLEKIKTESILESDDGYSYYSCVIDGFSEIEDNGKRKPKYKIKLSGNPILGDGKADNQNHALIFYRGEYIQVIDANQDNYLEECLKIRSVLSEFEEFTDLDVNPYVAGIQVEKKCPVAIVGAREYIFSENAGVLGDVAAGKEQTFGTLSARTLAIIGGKLHYGHPDFLNAIFMTTRGGISKAQKGLHLNEDIYAGMNAVCRGGRIKHSDYYQCGKGRDLGFGSILNFTTKIGAGMGEQLLSREYYYMGTQLPLDRFLSFYYAHAGFHINNAFIILSVNLFMGVIMNLGALNQESIKCRYNRDVPITDILEPLGCYNIQPVLDWVSRFVLSIFICFFIAFLPLILQEFTERGFWKAFTRLFMHFISLSPIFEVFVCQIYSKSLTDNLIFGGAKYISSGRGFATARLPFSEQYSKFASTSIYDGSYIFLALLFATLSMWQPAILWFWITTVSLCLAPFIFNPHQFSMGDFFVDYKDYMSWLTKGNSKFETKSWITFVRENRSRFTGYKTGKLSSKIKNIQKPSLFNLITGNLLVSLFYLVSVFFAYTFINSQNGVQNVKPTNSLLRLIISVFFPILFNCVILVITVPISLTFGNTLNCCLKNTATLIAAVAHALSVIVYLIDFQILWLLEGYNISRTLLALICTISMQNLLFQTITILLLTREEKHSDVNKAWWDGSWITAKTDNFKIILFFREFFVKAIELSLFSLDFILGHFLLFIQTPILFIPYIDKWHSIMLFWFKPHSYLLRIPLAKKKKKSRQRIVIKYALLYFLLLSVFLILLIVPPFTASYIPDVNRFIPTIMDGIVQPRHQNNNDTGEFAPQTVLRNTPDAPIIKTMF